MAVGIRVLRESAPGERRVAATPETVKKLVAAQATVQVESGAGAAAGFVDAAYADAGAQIVDASGRDGADLVLCVQPPHAATLGHLKPGAALVGKLHPQADQARGHGVQPVNRAARPVAPARPRLL